MIWQILIATIEARTAQLRDLLDVLAPQLSDQVEVLAYRDNLQALIGAKRDALVAAASAQYVSHLDDDDQVPEDYVATILPLLDGVDYVSYNIEANGGGYDGFTVKHQLHEPTGWFATHRSVDIGHLMPMRLELHRLGEFGANGWQEDVAWADQVRASGRVRSEHHIDRTLYNYRVSDGAMWGPGRIPAAVTTPDPVYPHVRFL